MRVRPLRQATRRTAPGTRRRHPTRLPDAPKPVPPAEPAAVRASRRVRESGGPEDRAFYTCSCGYAFEADVTTSVACPHCGTTQAW
jgi:rubrerythrin